MKVSDVLAHIRTRLNDDNAEFTKKGDNYLINLIYFWQNQIISEFALNVAEFECEMDDEKEIEMPFETSRLLFVELNGEKIEPSSLKWAINKKFGVGFYEKSPQIYAFTRNVSGNVKIYAVKKAFISDKDDDMVIGDDFINLLVFYVFLDVLKAQITPENTQRINTYEILAEKERQRMISFLNRKNNTSGVIYSPFIKA